MIVHAPNLNHCWAGLLIEELVRGGVCCFCITPGSRSTPLAVAAASNPGAKTMVHFDERGAAFHALGWAAATGQPAVLICTSGSAPANYWPAVTEASASMIPLILLTADRPPELRDCGANQAIDQTNLFGQYVRWFHSLPCPNPVLPARMILTTADHALYRARSTPAGPVHINCMFREPLAPVPFQESEVAQALAPLEKWLSSDAPFTKAYLPEVAINDKDDLAVINRLSDVERGLLVIGRLRTREEVRTVRILADALRWPVFPDVLSGLRLGVLDGTFVHYYDQLLLSPAFREACAPEFVLHLGGAITSKRLQDHLAALAPEYMLVANHPVRHDPFHQLTHRIETDVAAFAHWLAPSVRDRGVAPWGQAFAGWSKMAGSFIDAWVDGSEQITEIFVARAVARLRPANTTLFLGNSMPIRDMDMYGAEDGPEGLVTANRGASGIDGNIATVAGYANATGQPVVAVLGDLAVLHDLNSLALIRESAAPVILVVVNNDGGGIFSFLPIAEYPETFERCFGVPHGRTFVDAARFFGIEYALRTSKAAFSETLTRAIAGKCSMIIEVQTERPENYAVHQELQRALTKMAFGS